MIDERLIIKKFAIYGRNIQPSAVEALISRIRPNDLDSAIEHICKTVNSFIITKDDIINALNSFKPEREVIRPVKKEEDRVCDIRVRDITGNSSCEGVIEDFIAYFNSRFEKLSSILMRRMRPVKISSVSNFQNERVEVIGMVRSVREVDDCVIVELEDKSGTVNVVVGNKLKKDVLELLGDEVIGVYGTVKGRNIIADRIVLPDIPSKEKVKKDFGIVFTSDTHFGSKEFLKKEWDLFIKWLSGEIGSGKIAEIASKIKYVIIAGDIVDGIGVYPEQERDLEIKNIYEQYEFSAEQIDRIPKDIKVIISVGNHDAIRQAEPQPALPKEYRDLFPNNVIHVGNPAFLELDDVRVLIYHGRSLDDLITKIPRLSYERPQEAMIELLKRRHLCPLYGEKTPIAPEKEDLLVIDEVPDVLHCGHIHTYGVGFYRGVLLVNSSTWQAQTEFQKRINLNPMPGNVAVYYNGEVGRLKFYQSIGK